MSAKFIYKMSEENPDLRKQIGCMNGFFQLFDRHHFLGGGGSKRVNGHNHKRLLPARNDHQETQDESVPQKSTEKNHKKTVKEKQRNSTESSRTSFSSSSCSSSFASVECTKPCQLEAPSSCQTVAAEAQPWEASIYRSPASLSGRQSLDLRDVVKDSIYRESRSLSIKTPTKGEAYGQTLKYVDSPRPLQSPRSVNSRNSGDRESSQVLHKLRESPCKSSERNDTLTPAVKDARRFSCDGRESRGAPKFINKLKELPRLSLDSKAGSMRSSTEMKSSYLLQNSETGNVNRNISVNQQEEPGSCKRASSVVARLMGLEALPDSMSTRQIDTSSYGRFEAYTALSTVTEDKQKQFTSSPRNQKKELISPRATNAFLTRKPATGSKFPIEPAPWKQLDGNRSSETALSKNMSTSKKPSNSLTVYGEIEKRLAQLEFKRSGKDLRALKQILETMQKTKQVLETSNGASNYATQTSSSSNLDLRTKAPNPQSTLKNSPISAIAKGNTSPEDLKSPIVIMKPAKLLGKAENPAFKGNLTESLPGLHRLGTSDSTGGRREAFSQRRTRDTTPRPNPAILSGQPTHFTSKTSNSRKLPQNSKESIFIRGESEISCESSGTINQKQCQHKLVLERQRHPGSVSPDSNKTQRQSSRQQTNVVSPRGKPRAKSSKPQRSDDDSTDVTTSIRDLNHQGDAISLQSDSNLSFASQIDEEVSSTDRSRKIDGPLYQQADWKRKDQVKSLSTEKVVAEQPSPVSVLDAFCSEEVPSPIKKKSIAFKDDEAPSPDDMEWNPTHANYSTGRTNSSINLLIDHKKVEVIQFLVQNVRHLLSVHEEAINHETTPLYDSTNPDHRYISDLLIVSGLLRDFESGFTTIHLHPTGYPIDPNLFTVLEQAKVSTEHSDDQSHKSTTQSKALVKSQRKLIFDVVNEILRHKLLSASSSKDTVSPNMLESKTTKGQQLLQELCTEVDRLQRIHSNCSLAEEDDYLQDMIWADLMHQSSNWTACLGEIPWLVLDVERLIFKDLICEIVADETHGIREQSAGHRRRLCSK